MATIKLSYDAFVSVMRGSGVSRDLTKLNLDGGFYVDVPDMLLSPLEMLAEAHDEEIGDAKEYLSPVSTH